MQPDAKAKAEKLLERMLHLSWRISIFAPPMKPFIRFSQRRYQDQVCHSKSFWDFDDLLQKKLVNLARAIAPSETIAQVCVRQWKHNCEGVYKRVKELREQIVRDNTEYSFDPDERISFIITRVKPGGRFLYIGCGAGRQCLVLKKEGLQVIGIDTMFPALELAGEWAMHWGAPFSLACMDVTELGFKSNSFDGFLLEFYGSWPSFNQTLSLQRRLADILVPDGQGFVVAARKKYSSYWFLIGNPYPSSMANWLIPQASLDFFFSETDSSEERLSYGLYNRSHTIQSLSAELARTFEVRECIYESDPRYVVAVVRPKGKASLYIKQKRENSLQKDVSLSALLATEQKVAKIEAVVDQLEAHAERTSAFFTNSKATSFGDFFHSTFDTARFVELLSDALDYDDNQTQSEGKR